VFRYLAFHHLIMTFRSVTIWGKIIKIVAIRGQILRIKCTKYYFFGWGSAPDPAGRLVKLQRSPRTPSWKGSGLLLKGWGREEKRRREDRGREGEGNGGEVM